jgi:hypothetical protein
LQSFFLCAYGLKEKSVYQILKTISACPPFLLMPKAQKKRLGEKKTPFPQGVALQPTRFFEKKRGKKL